MMWDVIAAAYMGAYQDAQRRADDAQRRADEESCIPTIERGSHGADCGWKCTGCKATNAGDVHRCKPKPRVVYCNLYKNGSTYFHPTAEEARQAAKNDRGQIGDSVKAFAVPFQQIGEGEQPA